MRCCDACHGHRKSHGNRDENIGELAKEYANEGLTRRHSRQRRTRLEINSIQQNGAAGWKPGADFVGVTSSRIDSDFKVDESEIIPTGGLLESGRRYAREFRNWERQPTDGLRLIIRGWLCSLRGALGPREPVSLGLIFCGSVKLPIKYSSRLFNCRNKEQTASHQPFARTLYSIFSGPEPSTLKAAGGASVYTKSTATPDTFHRLMPRQGVVAWRCNPWRSRISGPRSLPRCWIWLVRFFVFHRTASIAFSRKKTWMCCYFYEIYSIAE